MVVKNILFFFEVVINRNTNKATLTELGKVQILLSIGTITHRDTMNIPQWMNLAT
jgi:hypothetical protein